MKFLLISALVLSSSFCALAQQHVIGAHTGLSLGYVRSNMFNASNRSPHIAPSFGLTYEYRFAKHFFAGLQLDYQQRGSRSEATVYREDGQPAGIATSIYDFKYLNASIRAGYRSGGEKWQWYVNGVFTPGILLNSRVRYTSTGNQLLIAPGPVDITSQMKRLDLAVGLEAGLDRKITERLSIGIKVGYQRSLSNFYRTDMPALIYREGKHSWLNTQLMFTYRAGN